jgi:glycosyltransferase involved in cell wall biosynthesis
MPERTRVLLLAPYPTRTAPSQRFRFEQYIEVLRADGIELDVRPLLERSAMGLLYEEGRFGRKSALLAGAATRRAAEVVRMRRYDVAFVHREAFPLGYPVFEWLIRRLRVPYLFDLDDAIYLPNVSAANRPLVALKRPHKAVAIARGARMVTVGNEFLAEWARRHNDEVRVIPTTIDTDLYRPREERPEGPPCVGWSGSRTTIQHLAPLRGVLRRLQLEWGVRLRVIGDASFSVPGAEVEALDWDEGREIQDLSELHVGLMPLPDDPWSRGKCGLKALQYMALGIPTVMSPVGVNREIGAAGAALFATSEREWHAAVCRLLDDPSLRAELAVRGRERVEARYSVTANSPRYRDAIRAAASTPARG